MAVQQSGGLRRRVAGERIAVRKHQSIVVQVGSDADPLAFAHALIADGEDCLHVWPGGGVSLTRIGGAGCVVIHSWPERGLWSVDAYGELPALTATWVAAAA